MVADIEDTPVFELSVDDITNQTASQIKKALMNCRFFSVAIFLPLLVMADGPGSPSTERDLGARMMECGLAWMYLYKAAGPSEEELEHCSALQQDAETRVGGQCKNHVLEQSRLFITEAWKHLPENKLIRMIDRKEQEIYAVADAPDPDAAIRDHIRELQCERRLNHSRMR